MTTVVGSRGGQLVKGEGVPEGIASIWEGRSIKGYSEEKRHRACPIWTGTILMVADLKTAQKWDGARKTNGRAETAGDRPSGFRRKKDVDGRGIVPEPQLNKTNKEGKVWRSMGKG